MDVLPKRAHEEVAIAPLEDLESNNLTCFVVPCAFLDVISLVFCLFYYFKESSSKIV